MPEDRRSLESYQIEEVAERVSEKTVAKTFQALGINLNDPDAIDAFRERQAWVKRQMQAQQDRHAGFWKGVWEHTPVVLTSAITSAIATIATYFWAHQP
jgi:hypothetical protein